MFKLLKESGKAALAPRRARLEVADAHATRRRGARAAARGRRGTAAAVRRRAVPTRHARRRAEGFQLLTLGSDCALLARGLSVGAQVVTDGAAELFGTEFGAAH